MTELLLIRHGQASAGAADYDRLSAIGMEQSRLLGLWLARCGWAPDLVASGGRRRQTESADATLAAMACAREVVVEPAFDEFDHQNILLAHRPDLAERGVLEAELADRTGFRRLFAAAVGRWMSGEHEGYRESWAGFRARVSAGLARVGGRGLGSVWVFTSAGPISAAVGETLGMARWRVWELTAAVMNGSVTRLVVEDGRVRLVSFNATPHLDVADGSLTTAL